MLANVPVMLRLSESAVGPPVASDLRRDENEIANMRFFQELRLRGGYLFKQICSGQKRVDFSALDVGNQVGEHRLIPSCAADQGEVL